MVMEVGRDNSRGSDDNNPFREAMEVINALAEEGDFEFEQAERMAQQQQAVEDQRHRRTLAPENPPPRQNAPHSSQHSMPSSQALVLVAYLHLCEFGESERFDQRPPCYLYSIAVLLSPSSDVNHHFNQSNWTSVSNRLPSRLNTLSLGTLQWIPASYPRAAIAGL